MPAAYVVLSHTEPEQVGRLVRAVLRSSPTATVFVTHDDRRHPAPVVDDPRVTVTTHGRPTDWGSWDLVEVTLQAMRAARDAVDPDVLALVSGQCYPVRSLAGWEDELRAAGGWQGTARPLHYTPRWGRLPGLGADELTRYDYRWFRTRALDHPVRRQGLGARVVWAVANRTEPVLSLRHVERGRGVYVGLRRPKALRAKDIRIGSQWLAVDRRHLGLLLDDFSPGSSLRRVYERSLIADESALQTALARHRPPSIATPVSHSVWVPGLDTTRTFTLDDLSEVRATGAPFCRKVDPVHSAALMDALDEGL